MKGDFKMKIAFLGWGSLIWSPGKLRITGLWKKDGPLLPVEFARISKDWRLTLVLYPDASNVQTLWAYADCEDLQEAIDNLANREQTSKNNIGFVSIPDNRSQCNVVPEILPRIKLWAKQKELDAVVWTDLPSKFVEKTNMELNENNAVKYLLELKRMDCKAFQKAKEYIRRAPEQIETKFRKRIRQEFGW